jgi:hypothetical protein
MMNILVVLALLFLLAIVVCFFESVRWSYRNWGWRNTLLWLFMLLGFCIWGPSVGIYFNLQGDRVFVLVCTLGGVVFGFAIGKLFVFVIDLFVLGPVEDSESEAADSEVDD